MIRYIALLLLATLSQSGSAAISDQEFSDLKQELMALMTRVEALEAENRELKESVVTRATATPQPAEDTKAGRWAESVSIRGDVRYRYENNDVEDNDRRERNRLRARVAITAQPTDNLELGLALASGSDHPGSANQTLGNGSSSKDINLDQAYFKWQAKPGFNLTGGKMSNVFFRPGGNGLLWDGDYRPEGLALTYHYGNYFLKSGINFLESDTGKANHTTAYGFQTGFEGSVGDNHLVAGLGYFTMDVSNQAVFFGDPDDFYGNTFSCIDPAARTDCTYNNDFEELELFAQFTTTIGETPVVLFADIVRNQDAAELDSAWAAGLKIGKASSAGTWEIGYTYQHLEADAVFGLITDSDFGGGGTDSKGHALRGAFAINSNWNIGFTYYDNERNMDLGRSMDDKKLLLDTGYRF